MNEIKAENNIINPNQDKIILKNKKLNKDNKVKLLKNNEIKEKENLNKKEDEINSSTQRSKRLSYKKIEKKNNEPEQEKEMESILNLNNKKDIKKYSSVEKKPLHKNEINNDNNEAILSRINKNNKKIDKLNEKKNTNIKNEDMDNDNTQDKNQSKKTRKRKKNNDENDIYNEKEKIREKNNNINEYNSLKKRNNGADLEKLLQNKLNNMNNQNQKEKSKKFETITQFKEKQENHSIKNKRSKNSNALNQSQSPKNQSRNHENENQETIESIEKKSNKYQSQKNILNNKKTKERKKEINPPSHLSISQKIIKSDNNDNNANNLTISHVNNINYLGESDNYFYLKNRVLRFNNKKTIDYNNIKEENKDNYDYNEEQLNEDNLYINTEYEKKRRDNFANKNKYSNIINNENDNDELARQKRLEKQKKKLKEELWKSGGGKSIKRKISNNNPINRINYHDETIEENDTKKQTIKIVHKNRNNKNKEKYKNPNLLNKKEKYEKNWNDQYIKPTSLDDVSNSEFPSEFKSTISVNTKIKNDPLKFITHYYLAKDKLNKITNNKETIEEEEPYNKYKNINFFEILKLLNENKRNNLPHKLNKFQDKQSKSRKIVHHNPKSNISSQINYYNETNNNNTNYSPLKTSINNNFHLTQSLPEYNQNNLYTMTDANNFRHYNYNTVARKVNKKRMISQNKKRKIRNNSVENTEKRLNSCKRMCRICNKSLKDNSEKENNNASSALIIGNYVIYESNSRKKNLKK